MIPNPSPPARPLDPSADTSNAVGAPNVDSAVGGRPALAWLALVGFALTATPILLVEPATLVEYCTRDDAFYYLQIARNWADGRGSTFDGEAITNGYQILWQFISVGLALLFDDPIRLLRASLVLSAGFTAASGYVLGRLASRLVPSEHVTLAGRTTLVAVMLAQLNVPMGLLTGMETPITLFVLSLLLTSIDGYADGSARTWRTIASTTALAGLLVLCRLDHAAVAGALIVAFAIDGPRRWKSLVAWVPPGLGVIAGVVVSAATYQAIGGTPVAVSGLVKLGGHAQAPWIANFLAAAFPFLVAPSKVLVLSGAAGVIASFGFVAWLSKRGFTRPLAETVGRVGAAMLAYCAFAAASVGELPQWYLASTVVFYSLFVALVCVEVRSIAARGASRPDLRAAVVGGGLVVLLVAGSMRSWLLPREGLYTARYELGRTIGAALGPTCRLGAFNAGQLGYFSRGRIVNLDGLVNSDAYRREVLGDPRRLERYLRERRIGGLVDYDFYWATDLVGGYETVQTVPIASGRKLIRLMRRTDSTDAACWAGFETDLSHARRR